MQFCSFPANLLLQWMKVVQLIIEFIMSNSQKSANYKLFIDNIMGNLIFRHQEPISKLF